jgi:hypothetical protein
MSGRGIFGVVIEKGAASAANRTTGQQAASRLDRELLDPVGHPSRAGAWLCALVRDHVDLLRPETSPCRPSRPGGPLGPFAEANFQAGCTRWRCCRPTMSPTPRRRAIPIPAPTPIAQSFQAKSEPPETGTDARRGEFSRHVARYGAAGVPKNLRARKAKTAEELAAASRDRDLQAVAKKRDARKNARRPTVKAEVAELLARKPNLLPSVVADVIGVSDRRVKAILAELAAAG